MIRNPAKQQVPRSTPRIGDITPLAIPYKGMNARAPFSVMSPEYGIMLINVISETFGLRTRKGYKEFAINLPGANTMVGTVMSYYAAAVVPDAIPQDAMSETVLGNFQRIKSMMLTPFTAPPLHGKIFAAKDNSIYDVTAGGPGPWTAETGVSGNGSRWTALNFQNVAGAFLLATNDNGGYAIYNGTAWTMPVGGSAAGQINGADPATFAYVMVWKKRVWFIQNNSTKAWYLPVEEITGTVTEFDFGSLFPHGGQLAALANWTVDGGEGIDDYMVVVSSQGDVLIYKGTDPDAVETFAQHGTWYVGPLPAGRRQVNVNGGDVYILSQFGVIPVSRLLSPSNLSQVTMASLSYNVDPIIARLMQDFAIYDGWQLCDASKEELVLIGIPREVSTPYGGDFFAYKRTTEAWTMLDNTTWASMVPVSSNIIAGTNDGRVVYAFQGPLDNVQLNTNTGIPIQCQVIPAFQPMGQPGIQKRFLLVRPTYLCSATPELKLQILVNYGVPKQPLVPALPAFIPSLWDQALWDEGRWGGLQNPISEWLGAEGTGFAATVQLDYLTSGNTLLTSIDFWTETSKGVL